MMVVQMTVKPRTKNLGLNPALTTKEYHRVNFYKCETRIDSSVHHRNSIAHVSSFQSTGHISFMVHVTRRLHVVVV